MYKRKLFYFGLSTAFILLVALICTAVSANLTRQNLAQSTVAQSLLVEHQQLSSISYRMFKQLTDEVIFGHNANQAEVRKKQALINQSLDNIRWLEIQQRQALGEAQTQGSIEDTDGLEALLQEIIQEFRLITSSNDTTPLHQQERLRALLEVTIDNQFREAINAAVSRQSRVVAAINARIDALNTTLVWFTLGLAIFSVPLLIYGCYWLFNQLYQPLILIRDATDSISAGNYKKPISVRLDEEFEELAVSINQLAARLREHDNQEAKSRKELEFEVEQRTRELTNANHQLTQIDARRKQFIADVSHELRTPLTIIRGEAQVTLRLKSASQEDYKETLSAILEQSVGLSRLVDDLLLLTRAEMNQLQLATEAVQVVPMLEAEAEKWQRLHNGREISFKSGLEGENTKALIDKPRIQQVLSILLDNATKYSASDQPIDLNISSKGDSVLVSITDHGTGISAAEVDNIFERFVRFGKNDEGLGLGLSIAKAIVKAHGGDITVESVVGQGSTFTLSLPIEQTV